MKITHTFSNFYSSKKTIVTIGSFDGVHIGHQKIINQLINASKKENKIAVLLTFFPHPRMVIQKDNTIKLINTIYEKCDLLEEIGLDELIIQPFNHEFSQLTAYEFVKKILVDKLNISKLIIGYDHHFGRNREGDFEKLQEYGKIYEFEIEEISVKNLNDSAVSSTKIRYSLEEGNIEMANTYLGYPFTLSGSIIFGNKLGSKIGFPTANILIKENYKLIPKTGVYIVKSFISNISYFGMMNIGNRPTINGKYQTIEVNFFDFNKDLYGKHIKIELLKFLRNERKFNSIDSLKEQLKKDEILSRKIISEQFRPKRFKL